MRRLNAIQRRSRVLRFVFPLMLLLPAVRGTAVGESRWVEFDSSADTITYDLNTVQMLDPGKFTIINKTIDHPDVMRYKLAVLDALRSYCTRRDGKYTPPAELFVLGEPDMPIREIEVKTRPVADGSGKFKNVVWVAPYRKLALNDRTGLVEYQHFFDCEGPAVESPEKEYTNLRSLIMNGIPRKEMYDCRHGVMGVFLHEDDPPSRVIAGTNFRGGFVQAYFRLCRAITGEPPYIPPDASGK